jgi:serine O-acetyltransferase
MIESKNDYMAFLKADRIALGMSQETLWDHFTDLTVGSVWSFQQVLRKIEYYQNCKKNYLKNPYYYYLLYSFRKSQLKYGFIIEPNCFCAGLSISHPGPIIVNPAAKIGVNCRIHPCTNIGTKAGFTDKVPKIGNNVYIGPGAKIFGDIIIADGIAIGANSVVNKSFFEQNITIAGVPARKINNRGSKGLIINATEIIGYNPVTQTI